jgi:magnesium transporter
MIERAVRVMSGRMKKLSGKAGLPPGTLVHIGEKKTEKVKITVIVYSEDTYREKELQSMNEYVSSEDRDTVTWINIDGLHQMEVMETIGRHFCLHPLTLEDIVNTGQYPKLEDYRDYLYIVLKMLYFQEQKNFIESEQVSICLHANVVISFQEEPGKDLFNPIRERIRNGKGRIRKMGADYLAYSLIDAIVDSYFIILEKLGEKIEALEQRVMNEPSQKFLHDIHSIKREIIFLRKSIWPLREVVRSLERGDSVLIQDSVHIYLRDVYDHTIRIIETIEAFRDILAGILDLYLSGISNRTNSVMKVLTIIATIFMPLTFLAGIYGMNFKYMPEIEWRWGYPSVLLIMVSLGIGMLVFFKRKKWM